eukprot:GEZU01029427.1.p2 GENE.GEZU01029427.1~~GEZU01029427.1.p2  ORF type:complete len:138 (-),score=24.73 GEZU01029427.1:577-990(-)
MMAIAMMQRQRQQQQEQTPTLPQIVCFHMLFRKIRWRCGFPAKELLQQHQCTPTTTMSVGDRNRQFMRKLTTNFRMIQSGIGSRAGDGYLVCSTVVDGSNDNLWAYSPTYSTNNEEEPGEQFVLVLEKTTRYQQQQQ